MFKYNFSTRRTLRKVWKLISDRCAHRKRQLVMLDTTACSIEQDEEKRQVVGVAGVNCSRNLIANLNSGWMITFLLSLLDILLIIIYCSIHRLDRRTSGVSCRNSTTFFWGVGDDRSRYHTITILCIILWKINIKRLEVCSGKLSVIGFSYGNNFWGIRILYYYLRFRVIMGGRGGQCALTHPGYASGIWQYEQ